MKIFSCMLLFAMGSMLCAEINESGQEAGVAVIQCAYPKGYEGNPKYFCKRIYKYCEPIIKTDGKESWAFKGRTSLNDNTEKKKFIVTITNLKLEDTGSYICGTDKKGQDLFTVVQLTVIKAPKPAQPKTSPTSSSTSSNHTTASSPAQTTPGASTTGWREATDVPQPLLDKGGYLGALLAAAMMGCVIAFVMIQRYNAKRAALMQSGNDTNTTRASCGYEEIFPTNSSSSGGQSIALAVSHGPLPHLPRAHPPLPTITFCSPSSPSTDPQTPTGNPGSPRLHYSTLSFGQNSLMTNDNSLFSREPQVVYTTIQKKKQDAPVPDGTVVSCNPRSTQ